MQSSLLLQSVWQMPFRPCIFKCIGSVKCILGARCVRVCGLCTVMRFWWLLRCSGRSGRRIRAPSVAAELNRGKEGHIWLWLKKNIDRQGHQSDGGNLGMKRTFSPPTRDCVIWEICDTRLRLHTHTHTGNVKERPTPGLYLKFYIACIAKLTQTGESVLAVEYQAPDGCPGVVVASQKLKRLSCVGFFRHGVMAVCWRVIPDRSSASLRCWNLSQEFLSQLDQVLRQGPPALRGRGHLPGAVIQWIARLSLFLHSQSGGALRFH